MYKEKLRKAPPEKRTQVWLDILGDDALSGLDQLALAHYMQTLSSDHLSETYQKYRKNRNKELLSRIKRKAS